MQTIIETLFCNAKKFPNKIALIIGEQKISYSDVAERVLAVSNYFSKLGVSEGEVVVLSADTSPAFVYGYFACHLLSAICVPVDPKCSMARLNYIVRKVRPCAIFTNKNYEIKGVFCACISVLLNFGQKELQEEKLPFPSIDSIADILFTSGTTDDAKGVILTHSAISTAVDHINRFIGNSIEDREVMPLPLSHSFGLGRLRCNIAIGATIILVPGFINPALILQAIDKHVATGFASVPAGFAILLRLASDRISKYVNQLKYIEIGSSPMDVEHKIQLIEMLPHTRICMHYGLTEASRSVFIEFHNDRDRLSSIGKPAPGVEVKIVNENGNKCNPDEMGRILVRGGHCSIGYWENNTLTKASFIENWLITGDVGYKDKYGYLYLVARENDLINIGGRKVAPDEIEALILKHPLIFDCVCVGIQDPRGITGMAVKAFLVAKNKNELPAEKEIDDILRGKIESYKIPVCYEWIDKIPKTESGKIQRNKLS